MIETLGAFLFSDGGYSPHGFCIAWNKPVLYTHIASDLLISLSYFAIPALIWRYVSKRRDPALHAPAMLFVAFITACGISHLMSIVTMYLPWYGLQGIMKLITGLVSFITVIALCKLYPEALKIPAPGVLMKALSEKENEIAGRKSVEESLRQTVLKLDQRVAETQAANRELREFAYAASHDLKSPANTLSLWLKDFEAEWGKDLDEDAHEAVQDAGRIIDRMRQLVEDILSYARVVDSDERIAEQVDPKQIFEEVATSLRDDISRARAKIVIEDMPPVTAHPALMSILAQNLLTNAIKFRSADRTPHITVSGRFLDGIDPVFELRVKDNGIGIDPSHKERVFSLFQRLHRSEDYEGTGLGLALCRRIAVTHGGTIEVISEEGDGAEFIVRLPMEAENVAQAA